MAVLMSELRDDILKEEEKFGGFMPGEPDEDTFILNNKPYPGDMTLFIDSSEIVSDDTDVEEPALDRDDEIENKDKTQITDDSDEINKQNLAAYVDGLLTASKNKKKINSGVKNINSSEIEIKPFEPVDENADTNIILSDLNLDKPSTSSLDTITSDTEERVEENNENAEKELENNITDEQVVMDEQNEHKSKKGLLIPVILAAASLIIAAALLILLPDMIKNSSESISESTAPTISDSSNVSDSEEKSDKNINTYDSVKISDEPIINSDSVSNEKSPSASIEPIISDNNIKTKIEAPETNTSSPENVRKPTEQKDIDIEAGIIRSTKQVKPKSIISQDNKNKQTAIKTKRDKKLLAEAKPEVKVNTDIEELRETAINETFVPKDEPGVYIVQIYSSPSKDDAQTWLDKLKIKNVPDAFISEQNVRDKVWYRVRFGNFRTREEARAAALRYGFAQTWIDRVK
ncbi:MAG: SPOR domain-containing protein [Candidatus Kapaibacterium sp.]